MGATKIGARPIAAMGRSYRRAVLFVVPAASRAASGCART